MKDESIEISSKRLPLRIVLFVLAVLIAVGAFTFGVKKLGGNEAGYAEVAARADGDAPLYAAHVRLTYRFEGGSRDIRQMKNEISDAYSAALARLYKLTDTQSEYPGYAGNLAELNRRVNREVTLPRELFDILREALELTERGEGYSVFDAPLYAEWQSIAYAADAADFDPLHSADEAERLRAVAEACADPENRSLEIVDEANCVVRLNAAQSYLDFLAEYELPAVLLDLGAMREAWILRGTAAALEEHGFPNGFLSTTGGLTLSLSGHIDGSYVIYSYVNKTPRLAASVAVEPGAASAAFTAFPITEDAAGFYTADDLLRCAVRPSADGSDAPVACTFALRLDGDVVAACHEALCLFLSEERAAAAAPDADLLAFVPAQGDGSTVFAAGRASDLLRPEKGMEIRTASP